MEFQFSVYSVPLLLATFISIYLAIFEWRRRKYPFFILLMIATAIWSFGYMMEILFIDKSMKILWAKIEYFGIVSIPVSWLITVMQYTGKDKWLTRRNIALLFIMPIITLALVWTNEMHHLIWRKIDIIETGSYSFLELIHGSAFWIHVAYSYTLVIISILLLLYALLNLPQIYKEKIVLLLIGAIIPWIGNILYTSGLSPFKFFDLTPFAVFISGLAMAWAVLRLKVLDILPIAREKLIEAMEDGIIVVDNGGYIIDANQSAKNLFSMENLIGEWVGRINEPWAKLLEKEECSEEVKIDGKYYHLTILPIFDTKNNRIGKLAIFHDITRRKKADIKIRQLNEELRLINKIVRHDILNDLQIIQGLLEMDYKGEKETFNKLMKRIEKSVNLMKRIKDVEFLASMDDKLKEYDMKEVINSVAKDYDVKINVRGNCKIKADDAIYSVIDNIFRNAVTHGKTDRIDVTLSEEDGYCEIKIADYGKGIPDEIKDKIFNEKFSYGDARGSGLGLYIVRKIIEKYGGSIEVKDSQPHGALFVIRIEKK